VDVSTIIELSGFAALIGGTWELLGFGAALIVLAVTLMFIGAVVSGLQVPSKEPKQDDGNV
jgi:hypothetical protein